jgi:two-component system sensor histidine kinase ChiS
VALPMYDEAGIKKAILSLVVSSRFEDAITARNKTNSLVITLISIVVVIMFLSLVLRIWDYAFLYKKVKEVDEMKDEFISMASHELRTPVTGIKGYSSMIMDGSFGLISDQIKNAVTIINASSNRLVTLVDDLLNVSRIEQGRMQTALKPLNIYGIIDEVVKELEVQADQKKLKLIYAPTTTDLPLISADSDHLKQVLINLIGNSIKYTESGKVEVLVEQADKKLLIKIKDTGLGMSAEARARLFQKFYRVQTEKTKKIVGTGLGLWITKQLVELMKGTIEVESMEDVGSQFIIKFPIINS